MSSFEIDTTELLASSDSVRKLSKDLLDLRPAWARIDSVMVSGVEANFITKGRELLQPWEPPTEGYRLRKSYKKGREPDNVGFDTGKLARKVLGGIKVKMSKRIMTLSLSKKFQGLASMLADNRRGAGRSGKKAPIVFMAINQRMKGSFFAGVNWHINTISNRFTRG